MLPEFSHHGEEFLHGGGLHVPGMLLLLFPGGVVQAEDVASDASHLGVVLHGGGLLHGGHHGALLGGGAAFGSQVIGLFTLITYFAPSPTHFLSISLTVSLGVFGASAPATFGFVLLEF